ncbi:MAG: helix-turn-helix domain-containing protein [Lentisphaeria bacterium]|nr:helix-turn-helix domain-containing protein [Lentisphaeria bacterium]
MYKFKKIPELNAADVDVIREMAQCDMNTQAVADKLHYSRESVRYHIKRIRLSTGLNPLRFFDLQELLKMVGGSNG